MAILIAILRGINVGGKRKIPMAGLRDLFENLKFSEVSTYIQSGNVLFKAPEAIGDSGISEKIEQAIQKEFGFEVPVILRTAEELQQAIDRNPFFGKDISEIDRLHLTFLKEPPPPENLEKISNFDFNPDKFAISGREVFVYCSGKYSDSKLSNKFFENKLGTGATTRNWKTVLKLKELAEKQKQPK
ncbi:MAG: DUF1697 domain-containing protein [Salegentibacter sp.]